MRRHVLMSKALGGMPNFCLKDREKSADDANPHDRAIRVSEGGRASAIRPQRLLQAQTLDEIRGRLAYQGLKHAMEVVGREHGRPSQVAQPDRPVQMAVDPVDGEIDPFDVRGGCVGPSFG